MKAIMYEGPEQLKRMGDTGTGAQSRRSETENSCMRNLWK